MKARVIVQTTERTKGSDSGIEGAYMLWVLDVHFSPLDGMIKVIYFLSDLRVSKPNKTEPSTLSCARICLYLGQQNEPC